MYQDRFDSKYFHLKTSKTFVQVEINNILHELGVEDRHLVARFETLWLQEADLKEEAARNFFRNRQISSETSATSSTCF